jgi:hypothetical protein
MFIIPTNAQTSTVILININQLILINRLILIFTLLVCVYVGIMNINSHVYYILFLWQRVSTQFIHLQPINIKLVRVLYTLVVDGNNNNGDLSSVIKPICVDVSDFVL